MRYTLRLLTLQQFQRATALICACESIRRQDERKWGQEPFRIGLWVGQRTTPNHTDQSEEFCKQARGQYQNSATGSPHQLTNCPWCGTKINSGQNITVETVKNGRGALSSTAAILWVGVCLANDNRKEKVCQFWWWMKKFTAVSPLS